MLFSKKINRSLALQALMKISLGVTVVIVASTAISYYYIQSILAVQIRQKLEKYVIERGQREAQLFTLAEDDLVQLQTETPRRLKEMVKDPQVEFSQLFVRYQDGAIRNRPETFDYTRQAGLFVNPHLVLTKDIRRRIVTFYNLLNAYGPAWKNRFASTYFVAPENFSVSFWPTVPIAQQQPADFYEPGEEYFWVADAKHDPQHKTVWTGDYYDPLVKRWMVSCIAPIYIDNSLITTVGHDVLIDELIKRTVNDQLPGTYNLIFRADGRLIAHPQLTKQLEASKGDYNILHQGDRHMQTILRMVKENPNSTIIEDLQNDEYLAATQIKGPDWYFVTVFPKSILTSQAMAAAHFVLLLGIAALLFELIVVYSILRQDVTKPLNKLTSATHQIANGTLSTKVDESKSNELGRLATSFNQMATQLRESFEVLEERVEERTVQLKEAALQAEVANLAKSEFLSNMSHELRTPLNGILGYAQILQRDVTASPKQKNSFQIIYKCGSHLLTLINDILDLAKIEARKLELSENNFHLESFLQDIVEICRVRAEQKEINFSFSTVNKLPTAVYADEKRLRQVLINLLGNAIKFTDRGTVTFKVGLVIPVSKIRFQIEDTGVGMTPEQLEKIFLPFEQVGDRSRMTQGTGLGLAISLSIVQQMDSELQVESEFGVGSKFWFDVELPSVEWVEVPTNRHIIGYEGERRKILVVDDRWENCSVIVNLLEPIGFEVQVAADGQQGFEHAIACQPDLIITDLVMPIMSGTELTQKLRSSPEFKNAVIIASSASVFSFDRQQSLGAGCNDFLPKPIQSEELFEQLQHYLAISWIHAEEEATPTEIELCIPPNEELTILYSAARIGDMKGVQQEALRLQQVDTRYLPFTEKLLQLAADMDEEAIFQLVQDIS